VRLFFERERVMLSLPSAELVVPSQYKQWTLTSERTVNRYAVSGITTGAQCYASFS
jgi:hypothetical protein